jgi:hypothetical protein
MRALPLLLALALPALAQDPLAPPAPSEEALRRETGRLLGELVRRKTTPPAEEALLELSIDERGRPFADTRVVEVAVRRGERGEDLRIRFREPDALRGQAHLRLADGRGYEHDRARRRSERGRPLEPTWRVGGGGLLLSDLLAEDLDAHVWTLLRDDTLDERPVHVVSVAPRAGGGERLISIDRERHVPLLVVHRDAAGAVVREVRLGEWRWVQGWLRPMSIVITEPGRTTTIVVSGRRASAPDARFDPDRFFEP